MDDENFREVTLFKLYKGDMALLSAACVLEYVTFDVKFVVESDSVLLIIESGTIKEIIPVSFLSFILKSAVFQPSYGIRQSFGKRARIIIKRTPRFFI